MIHVLYAEDDPHVAEMVRLTFSRHPDEFVLDVVGSGRGCLLAMQHRKHDVLLLDLVMPDMNGLDVLAELIAVRESTPVIMVSAHGQHDLAVRAMRAGAVDCIDKNSSEFHRMPEIVRRVHQRHRRRPNGSDPTASPVRTVLLVDQSESEREQLGIFLTTSLPRLKLLLEPMSALPQLLRNGTHFDAVLICPSVPADDMLAALRLLRAHDEGLPAIVISSTDHAETTIAAFRLGAHDYLLAGNDCHTDLVFSLNHALKHAATEKLNASLTTELANLNQSLAGQVAARTRDLENEIAVRRLAERRTEENAARLQALSTRLLRVQEDERHSLAQELHDQIGQLLTGLRFQLDAARRAAPLPSMDNAIAITDELLRSVRALTLQLRPRLLDDLGLRPALEWHANTFSRQTGIGIDLELCLPETRFGPQLEIVVFRMVQEALTNVARHSGAGSASVTVTADDHSLHVEVSDRGCGFDPAVCLARHDSLGLAGVAERVRLAGGSFELFSRAGDGTRLHAEFPLSPPIPK